MPEITAKTKLLKALKAANYSARAGGTIVGNLALANDGKFTSGGGGAAPAPKPSKAETATNYNKNQILHALIRQATKAASDNRPKKGPGSRGGKFWIDKNGRVRYGLKPADNTSQSKPGSSPDNKTKPVSTPESDRQILAKQRVLTQISKLIKSGKDEHGKPLSLDDRDKLELLSMRIRAELKGPVKKEIAADPVHTGAMIAFYVDSFSPDAAVQLQVPGGESWDALHMTLTYLGDTTELGPDAESMVYQTVSEFAANRSPLEGMVSGVGLFNNTEEGDSNAFYASFDSPALPDFRAQLMGMLQANGLMPVQNHGFTPHITLQYVPKGQPLPQIELPNMPILFPKITIKWGDKRTDFSLGRVTKEVKTEITAKANARLPFTVFKDAKGQYRWVSVSSSGYEDHDRETVSVKALADDATRKDATKEYGPLLWWHTPIVLGQCDFNAMDGPLLVESGTFVNSRVAEAIDRAITSNKFQPGISLGFEHAEPGPPVLPGRVFKTINKIERSLLPAWKASNKLTSFEVLSLVNAATADKEVKNKMIPKEKLEQLAALDIPPELLDGLLAKNELAIKSLELAGISYKAMAPVPPVDEDLTKLDQKADDALVDDPAALVEEPLTEEDPEPEDMGDESDPDAAIHELYTEIDKIVAAKVGEAVTEIKAALGSVGSGTASKEITDLVAVQALALKETTNLLEKFGADMTAVKSQLAALEGKQPPAVRQRTSATKNNEVTDPQILEALKEQNKTTLDPNDPFASFYQNWQAQGAPLPLGK